MIKLQPTQYFTTRTFKTQFPLVTRCMRVRSTNVGVAESGKCTISGKYNLVYALKAGAKSAGRRLRFCEPRRMHQTDSSPPPHYAYGEPVDLLHDLMWKELSSCVEVEKNRLYFMNKVVVCWNILVGVAPPSRTLYNLLVWPHLEFATHAHRTLLTTPIV